MTRRCCKSQHPHRATQRDNHARRIIRRLIKGKMIGQTEGMCAAWFWRAIHGGHYPRRVAVRLRVCCLISVRQALHNPA